MRLSFVSARLILLDSSELSSAYVSRSKPPRILWGSFMEGHTVLANATQMENVSILPWLQGVITAISTACRYRVED